MFVNFCFIWHEIGPDLGEKLVEAPFCRQSFFNFLSFGSYSFLCRLLLLGLIFQIGNLLVFRLYLGLLALDLVHEKAMVLLQ